MREEVLIVGGNGFLGRALVQKCIEQNWYVDLLINKQTGDTSTGVRQVVPSEKLKSLSEKKYKYIFNVAAFVPYQAYDKPDDRLVDANISLPIDLHKTFPDSKHIFASSVSVYGYNNGIINEESQYVRPTLYGLSKLSGELITKLHPQYAVIRFSSIYGKGMYQGSFIPSLIRDAKNKKIITLYGNGEREQNYLHVRDAAQFCINAAFYGNNKVYLGVNIHSHKNREVAAMVCNNIDNSQVIHRGVDDSASFLYNNDYTLSTLKYTPRILLEDGIKEMINE